MALIDAAVRRGGARAASGLSDPTSTAAHDVVRLPVSEVTIGSWRLVSKQPEHVVLAASGGQRALWLEVMQIGSVRRLELSFDAISTLVASTENGYDGEDGARLVVQCLAPPRFSKEAASGGKPGRGAFVPTADFTSGNASQVDTHAYRFARGVLEPALERLRAFGLRFDDGESGAELAAMAAEVVAAAAAAGAARRPKPYIPRSLNTTACTPSPREQASALLEQLEREMSDRQARYAGVCPVRAQIYEAVFAELVGILRADEPKRGALLERVRAEGLMTIAAYGTVFEHSTHFGSRKLADALALKAELQARVEALEAELEGLRKEVDEAAKLVETEEYRAADEAKRSEAKPKEISELEAQNAMLEQLLEVLKPSAPLKPHKDEK